MKETDRPKSKTRLRPGAAAKQPSARYFVYILKCRDGSLYTGITNNIRLREAAHNAGRGSAYVRSRGGGKVVYSVRCKNKSLALKREAAVKKLPRPAKLLLVAQFQKNTSTDRRGQGRR